MSPRRWLLLTIALTLGTGGAVVALNTQFDLYGLYRSTTGRSLSVYGETRVAKYLLSMRYVPENFNAVLMGSSLSANWDLREIKGLRVYNESLQGATIAEEKALLEAALSRPGVRFAFLIVHPALTTASDFKVVPLTPALKYSSLGSLSLWFGYKEWAKARLLKAPHRFDDAGDEEFPSYPKELNANMKRLWDPGEFEVNPAAFDAYMDLVAKLRARQVQLVFVIPPTFEGLLEGKRGAFDRYVQRVRTAVGGTEPWIDFTSDTYAGFRRDRANFCDGVHFYPQSARQVVARLDTTVGELLAQGRLRPARP